MIEFCLDDYDDHPEDIPNEVWVKLFARSIENVVADDPEFMLGCMIAMGSKLEALDLPTKEDKMHWMTMIIMKSFQQVGEHFAQAWGGLYNGDTNVRSD